MPKSVKRAKRRVPRLRWTMEAAVPFKPIRYAPGTVQDWGFQARRTNKSKNEIAYPTKLPPALGLGRADFSASLYANLVSFETARRIRSPRRPALT